MASILNGIQPPSSWVGNNGDAFFDSAHNKVYSKASDAWSLVLDPDNLSSIALTSAHILVGNSSNIATDVALSGDISITNAGVSAIVSIPASVASVQSINAQVGTTYTLVLGDLGKLVTLTNASAITLTVPTNASVAYAVGSRIDIAQLGAGQVTVAGAGGVTVSATPGLKLSAQYAGGSLIKTATNTWLLVGSLSA